MNWLNIFANANGVPLVLSDDGKKLAIAAKVADTESGEDTAPISERRGHANVALDYLLDLAKKNELDEVIGGYDSKRFEHVVLGVPCDGFNDNERRAATRALLLGLVKHLAVDSRDVGNTEP